MKFERYFVNLLWFNVEENVNFVTDYVKFKTLSSCLYCSNESHKQSTPVLVMK